MSVLYMEGIDDEVRQSVWSTIDAAKESDKESQIADENDRNPHEPICQTTTPAKRF